MPETLFDVGAITEGRSDKPRKVNLFETPNLFGDVHVLRPGQLAKIHTHAKEDKAYLVLSGEGRIQAGDQEHVARPGHLVFCPAGLPHGARNEGPDDLRLLVIMAPRPRPREP